MQILLHALPYFINISAAS